VRSSRWRKGTLCTRRRLCSNLRSTRAHRRVGIGAPSSPSATGVEERCARVGTGRFSAATSGEGRREERQPGSLSALGLLYHHLHSTRMVHGGGGGDHHQLCSTTIYILHAWRTAVSGGHHHASGRADPPFHATTGGAQGVPDLILRFCFLLVVVHVVNEATMWCAA